MSSIVNKGDNWLWPKKYILKAVYSSSIRCWEEVQIIVGTLELPGLNFSIQSNQNNIKQISDENNVND